MISGWEVELDDGTIYQEETTEWSSIPKKRIKRLSLLSHGRRWDFYNKQAYFVRNTASVIPGIPESFQIERRCVGYFEGKDKVSYTVDEWTGRVTIKVE